MTQQAKFVQELRNLNEQFHKYDGIWKMAFCDAPYVNFT